MTPLEKTELEELRKLSRQKDSTLSDRQRERLAYLSIRKRYDARNRWGPTWDFMTFLFYKADIEGLCGTVCDGAPYDEYEPEIEEILPRLFVLHTEGKLTAESAKKEMIEVFMHFFAAHPDKEPPKTYTDKFDFPAQVVSNFFAGHPHMFSIRDCEEFLK